MSHLAVLLHPAHRSWRTAPAMAAGLLLALACGAALPLLLVTAPAGGAGIALLSLLCRRCFAVAEGLPATATAGPAGVALQGRRSSTSVDWSDVVAVLPRLSRRIWGHEDAFILRRDGSAIPLPPGLARGSVERWRQDNGGAVPARARRDGTAPAAAALPAAPLHVDWWGSVAAVCGLAVGTWPLLGWEVAGALAVVVLLAGVARLAPRSRAWVRDGDVLLPRARSRT